MNCTKIVYLILLLDAIRFEQNLIVLSFDLGFLFRRYRKPIAVSVVETLIYSIYTLYGIEQMYRFKNGPFLSV